MKRSFPFRFAGRRPGGTNAGYNLVILVMAITTLNILVAMALPVWSHMIRREKEEQLIFRGLQYAEALRLYAVRHGGQYPVKLEQLIKEEPRSIRQLWSNPLREDGKWTLLFTPPGAGGQPVPGTEDNQDGQPLEDRRQPPGTGQIPTQVLVEFDPKKPESQVVQGPIMGVFSSEGGEAIKMFNNSSNISEWQFRVELLNPVAPPPGAENPQPQPVNASRIGRPFPPGVTPLTQPVGGPGQDLGGGAGVGRGGAVGSGVGGVNQGAGGRRGLGGGRSGGAGQRGDGRPDGG